jgi:hypothetical protein
MSKKRSSIKSIEKSIENLSQGEKLVGSVAWDILDLTLFRIPGLGTFTDILATYVAYKFWGPIGLLASVEVLDVTDQVDSFLPTMTLIALYSITKR